MLIQWIMWFISGFGERMAWPLSTSHTSHSDVRNVTVYTKTSSQIQKSSIQGFGRRQERGRSRLSETLGFHIYDGRSEKLTMYHFHLGMCNRKAKPSCCLFICLCSVALNVHMFVFFVNGYFLLEFFSTGSSLCIILQVHKCYVNWLMFKICDIFLLKSIWGTSFYCARFTF